MPTLSFQIQSDAKAEKLSIAENQVVLKESLDKLLAMSQAERQKRLDAVINLK